MLLLIVFSFIFLRFSYNFAAVIWEQNVDILGPFYDGHVNLV